MPMSCNICTEKFNKTSRSLIKCSCDFECCRMCAKNYLLGKKDGVSCMSCSTTWTRKFMSDNFEKTFMGKAYKEFRENVLFESEIGMLQATQHHVEREIRVEKINSTLSQLRLQFYKDVNRLETELRDTQNQNEEKIERRKFVRKCPNGDCHGFLSSSLKCELCECWACSECRESKGITTKEKNQHVCNKDIVESVKFMEKDSKPCPKCSSMISKVSGCDQMYCVECHTAFDWTTLRIVTGVIHNPHFYEFQRRQNNGVAPRNPLDLPCGRQEIDHNFIRRLCDVFKRNDPIIEIARNILHIRHVEQRRFRVDDNLNKNLILRIKYMRNKIDKDNFKKSIQKNEKLNQKNTEITNVLIMYTDCMTDIIHRLISNISIYDDINCEIDNLKKYTNECFTNISNSYNCKNYEINRRNIFI